MAEVKAPSGSVVTVSDKFAETLVASGWTYAGEVPEPVEAEVEAPKPAAAVEPEAEQVPEPAEPEKRKPGRPKKD